MQIVYIEAQSIRYKVYFNIEEFSRIWRVVKYINEICNKPVSKKFDNLSLVVNHLRKTFHAFEKSATNNCTREKN